jgi:hypothetical protein
MTWQEMGLERLPQLLLIILKKKGLAKCGGLPL